jgi:type II secretory pathway pseudopilin PulG
MGLEGQDTSGRWRAVKTREGATRTRNERGYAMAALLVMLAVMGILMSVAMPVWRQQARREKEAELVFRGEQYARAIALYNFKNQQQGRGGMTLPPSIDVLVDGRYLRKKYKDPMTKDGEFVVIPAAGSPTAGQTVQPQPGQPQRGTAQLPPGARGSLLPQPQPSGRAGTPLAIGGIMGVRSKSEENALRSYRGQTRYDQWLFTFNNVRRPGGQAPATGGPGQRPGPPDTTGPGGRRTGPGTSNPFPGSGNPINPGRGGTSPPGRGGRGPGL